MQFIAECIFKKLMENLALAMITQVTTASNSGQSAGNDHHFSTTEDAVEASVA
jgi:hypothetical protein